MTKLSQAQLALYESSASGQKQLDDARTLARHKRIARGVIRIPHGPYTITFYPIKDCLSTIGVTNQTLRNWINSRVVPCDRRYDMYTLCRAEQVAIRRVLDRYWDQHKRNSELPASFTKEMVGSLNAVREALETLRRGKSLTDQHRQLLQPSLDEPQH